MRALKLVLVNVGVLLALVTFLNVSAAVVLFATGGGLKVDPESDFFDRPSHESHDKAVSIYRDFHALDTEYHPFVAWRRMPYEGSTTTVDTNGRRTHPRDEKDSQSARQVAMFGGSTMWGSGADDRGTIPAHVDYSSPDLTTINLGESGWTSRQSLDMFINLVDADTPLDAAIFYDGVNDVAVVCREGRSVNTHGQAPLIHGALRREKTNVAVFMKVFDPTITLLSKVLAKMRTSSMADISFRCASDPAHAEAVAETLLRNWEMAHAIAEARGIQFFGVLQPVSYYGEAKIEYLDREETIEAEYRAVYPIVQKKMAERGHAWMVDLTKIFDGDQPLYVDYCHVSTKGNAMVAKRFHDLLAAPEPVEPEEPVEPTEPQRD